MNFYIYFAFIQLWMFCCVAFHEVQAQDERGCELLKGSASMRTNAPYILHLTRGLELKYRQKIKLLNMRCSVEHFVRTLMSRFNLNLEELASTATVGTPIVFASTINPDRHSLQLRFSVSEIHGMKVVTISEFYIRKFNKNELTSLKLKVAPDFKSAQWTVGELKDQILLAELEKRIVPTTFDEQAVSSPEQYFILFDDLLGRYFKVHIHQLNSEGQKVMMLKEVSEITHENFLHEKSRYARLLLMRAPDKNYYQDYEHEFRNDQILRVSAEDFIFYDRMFGLGPDAIIALIRRSSLTRLHAYDKSSGGLTILERMHEGKIAGNYLVLKFVFQNEANNFVLSDARRVREPILEWDAWMKTNGKVLRAESASLLAHDTQNVGSAFWSILRIFHKGSALPMYYRVDYAWHEQSRSLQVKSVEDLNSDAALKNKVLESYANLHYKSLRKDIVHQPDDFKKSMKIIYNYGVYLEHLFTHHSFIDMKRACASLKDGFNFRMLANGDLLLDAIGTTSTGAAYLFTLHRAKKRNPSLAYIADSRQLNPRELQQLVLSNQMSLNEFLSRPINP